MASRIELHKELEELFGTKNVYFQPPESAKLKYDCVIYSRRTGEIKFADNNPYTFHMCYEVTLIRKTPENDWVEKFAMHFPKSRYDRNFKSDNLEHDVFIIYY